VEYQYVPPAVAILPSGRASIRKQVIPVVCDCMGDGIVVGHERIAVSHIKKTGSLALSSALLLCGEVTRRPLSSGVVGFTDTLVALS